MGGKIPQLAGGPDGHHLIHDWFDPDGHRQQWPDKQHIDFASGWQIEQTLRSLMFVSVRCQAVGRDHWCKRAQYHSTSSQSKVKRGKPGMWGELWVFALAQSGKAYSCTTAYRQRANKMLWPLLADVIHLYMHSMVENNLILITKCVFFYLALIIQIPAVSQRCDSLHPNGKCFNTMSL